MKKIFPLLLALLLLLSACGKKTDTSSESDGTAAQEVPESEQKTGTASEGDGTAAQEVPESEQKIAKLRDADSEDDADWAKKLPTLAPEESQLARRVKYNDEGVMVSYLDYSYDAEGYLIEECPRNADGTIREDGFAYRYTYEYENGYCVAKNSYNAQGQLCYRYKLDAEGREWKWIVYDEAGSIKLWYIDEFDEYGNVTRHTQYEDGELPVLQNAREYDYNEHGDPTECRYVDSDGNVLNRYTYRYVYDDAGRIIECEEDDLGANMVQEWYKYSYDDAGRLIAKTQLDAGARATIQDVYEYDAAGRVRYDRIYASSGMLAATLEYLWQ